MTRTLWGAAVIAVSALGLAVVARPTAPTPAVAAGPYATQPADQGPADQRPDERVEVPPPPFSEDIFPCSSCHAEMPADRTRRELGFHTEIELKHDEEHRWCLDCHNADDRDYLHLASGELVPFEESYRLCGQCHGEKYRDWRAGVHGRRSGDWNGHKTYLLCAHCHNPHQPRFAPIAPMPAPIPPADTIRRRGDG